MNEITAVVLTKNEELYIADCLASLGWCDQVIVFDSLSSDRTVEIAQQVGACVIQRSFTNFADQRNAAIQAVETAWVFFVDADERVPLDLAEEIRKAVQDPMYNGYWIPTHNYQIGRLIRHAGLFPDYHLRLFRKDRGIYNPAQKVHEHLTLQGPAGYLTQPLIHLSCERWEDFIDHQKKYARMKAEVHYARGVKPSYHFIVGPILEFLRRYIYLQGFRDGLHGLRLSWIFAYYYFVMYVYLARLWYRLEKSPSLKDDGAQ